MKLLPQLGANAAGVERVAPVATTASIGNLKKEIMLDLGGGIKMGLILIPAGTFEMGSPESESGRSSEEALHTVTISKPYYIGKFHVTQEQYKATASYPIRVFFADEPIQSMSTVPQPFAGSL